jgi:serine protease Do
MSDLQHTFPRRVFVSVVLVSAVVSTLFGFGAGILAGDSVLRDQVLASLSVGPGAGWRGKLALPNIPAAPKPPQPPPMSDEDRRIAVVENVSPAVVSIIISKDVPVYEQYYVNPFQNGGGNSNSLFQQMFGNNPAFQVPQQRQKGTEKREVGAGSGFLVSADGYIVTNRHVVTDETAEYTVITQDKNKYTAKVLARDPVNDIAVIKIEKTDGKDFPFVEFGDSSQLKVGQSVVAIGYALGQFSNTVSNGIVAGLQRRIQAGDGMNSSEDLFDVIQTDAAINPGNSGGPLLDMHGKAIGVDVAIVQGSQNIGFALPANEVKRAVDAVRKGGKITRAYLGVRYQVISKELQDKNQLPVDYGALVARGQDQSELAIMPGSPADIAGIVENDIILEADGVKLSEDLPLAAVMSKYGVGDKVKLKVLHKGQEKTVEVTLAERK